MPKKVNYTSGVLCGDEGDNSINIAFWEGLGVDDVEQDCFGMWTGPAYPREIYVWKLTKFRRLYDLTDENGKRCAPPRKGQAFECEVEL